MLHPVRLPLSVLLAVALFGLAASASAAPGARSLSVAAATPFIGTGVVLAKGESVLITATGTISYGSQNPACAGSRITPAGCGAETICPVKGGCGALVGRLGNGTPFFVGTSKVVNRPGALWLGINDLKGAFADNSGAFDVMLSVTNVRSGTVTLNFTNYKTWSKTFFAVKNGTTLKICDTAQISTQPYSPQLNWRGTQELGPRECLTKKLTLPLGKLPATVEILDGLHPRVRALVQIVP
jgi:hypothetical protein